ncbi:aromatic amino acid lyase [Prescottella soli]|uniref:Aromatic amino acid lyase n=1 Tax=Prescottella soli TaxID=1543852 RepID=A0ABW9G1G1_9NOCA
MSAPEKVGACCPTEGRCDALSLTGGRLCVDDVVAVAAGTHGVVVPDTAWERVAEGHLSMTAARERGAVYGANTGVGANKRDVVEDSGALALRLWRSHCAGVGKVLDPEVTRAAMTIRLNQLLMGRSGVGIPLVRGLADAVARGSLPALHELGGLGTGDIAQLAELALTLVGERPWLDSGDHWGTPVQAAETDGLPFMSSNAVTLAGAALAVHEAEALLRAVEQVAGVSCLGLAGFTDAWDERVHASRPESAQSRVAMRLHDAVIDRPRPGGRVQDGFGLRVLSAVLGSAWEAVTRLREAVESECSTPSENPLVLDDGVRHHGLFHLASVSGLLDHVRLELTQVMALAAARVTMLADPNTNGQYAFCSDGVPGSSGLMIGEYVVTDALASMRALSASAAAPVSISMGVENHASFATQGVRKLRQLLEMAWWVVAVEALSAVRCLRPDAVHVAQCPALEVFAELDAVVDRDHSDHPLDLDLNAVLGVLRRQQ